MLFIDKICLNQ